MIEGKSYFISYWWNEIKWFKRNPPWIKESECESDFIEILESGEECLKYFVESIIEIKLLHPNRIEVQGILKVEYYNFWHPAKYKWKITKTRREKFWVRGTWRRILKKIERLSPSLIESQQNCTFKMRKTLTFFKQI